MQKNVYFLIRNTVNAAKHKLRQVFVEHFFSLKYINKSIKLTADFSAMKRSFKRLTSVVKGRWKQQLKAINVDYLGIK